MQAFTRLALAIFLQHVASADASSLSGMAQQPEANTLEKNGRITSLSFLLCVLHGAVVAPEPFST